MATSQKRCMVCGKPLEESQSICKPCEESIRGEAVGKKKRAEKTVEKEFRPSGQVSPRDGDKKE